MLTEGNAKTNIKKQLLSDKPKGPPPKPAPLHPLVRVLLVQWNKNNV